MRAHALAAQAVQKATSGGAIASVYGQGGVLPGMEPAWLWVVRSIIRTTFSPSTFTSIDHIVKNTLPVFFCVTTPFIGAAPASSPVLFLKLLLFLSITSSPEIFTVVE